MLESREGGVKEGVKGVGGARGDMRVVSGHRRQRALEELRDDVLHALGLALGEGAVQLREGVLREGSDDHRRDAAGGPERGVQDEDLDVGAGLRGIEPAAEVPPPARTPRRAFTSYQSLATVVARPCQYVDSALVVNGGASGPRVNPSPMGPWE